MYMQYTLVFCLSASQIIAASEVRQDGEILVRLERRGILLIVQMFWKICLLFVVRNDNSRKED